MLVPMENEILPIFACLCAGEYGLLSSWDEFDTFQEVVIKSWYVPDV